MLDHPHRPLEKAIGYRFRKRSRLHQALTHSSYTHENEDAGEDNQRLEFLGDAVLGAAAATHLYATRPDLDEGAMTKLRSRLTNTRTLAVVATGLGLGRFIRLGRGETASGGQLRDSILADSLEAVLGAIYLDGGMRAITRVFETLFVPMLADSTHAEAHDNPKGRLQEFTQTKLLTNPRYRLVSQTGPAHATIFVAEVCAGDLCLGRGEGRSKQAAEIAAAGDALAHPDRLESSTPTPPADPEALPGD